LKADGTVVVVGYNKNRQFNTESWRDIGSVPKENILRWKQSLQWEQQGLCKYCGGKLGGLITKKCESCGKAN